MKLKLWKVLKKIVSKCQEKQSQFEWENNILKNEIEKLEEELIRKKYEQKEDDKNGDLLNSLHSKGIIDADGNIMT